MKDPDFLTAYCAVFCENEFRFLVVSNRPIPQRHYWEIMEQTESIWEAIEAGGPIQDEVLGHMGAGLEPYLNAYPEIDTLFLLHARNCGFNFSIPEIAQVGYEP